MSHEQYQRAKKLLEAGYKPRTVAKMLGLSLKKLYSTFIVQP